MIIGETEKGVKVSAQTGMGVVMAKYDADLNYIGIDTSPIRWIVTDVKRIGRMERNMAEGQECDVRFMLKTQVSIRSPLLT